VLSFKSENEECSLKSIFDVSANTLSPTLTHPNTSSPQIGGVGLAGIFSVFAFALGTVVSFMAMLKHRLEAFVFAMAVALLQPAVFRWC
jgi:hypothetical protein